MADDFSLRDNVENEAQQSKDTIDTLTSPLKGKIQDEISDRIAKHVADVAAKNAAQTAAQTAGTAGVAGTAGAVATNAAAAETGATATGVATTGTVAAGGTTAGGAAAAGGAVAEGAAAGTAGGPAGIVVGAIIGAIVATASAIKNGTDVAIDKDDPNGTKINGLFLIIAIILIGFTTICGTLISKGVASTVSVGQETEFQNTVVDGKNMAEAGNQYKNGTTLLEFNNKLPLQNAIWQYTFGRGENGEKFGKGTKEGLRKTLDNAIRKHCWNIIQQLEKYTGPMNGHRYDDERSLDSFYQNKWPYDLATSDHTPLIGDVLIPNQPPYKSWNPRYDDVNYAEIFSIFSMTDAVANGAQYSFDWGDVNYKDFMDYLQKEECYRYMYELGLKWVPVYRGEKVEFVEGDPNTDADDTYVTTPVEAEPFEFDSPDACRNAPEQITWDGVECTWDEYYVNVTVKPAGLRELFAMAFNTTDPVSASNDYHVNFYLHQNLYMLEYTERVTRLYERDDRSVEYKVGDVVVSSGNDPLGPSYKDPRSNRSSVYWDVNQSQWLIEKGWQGKGRSPWYYIEKTYNDQFEVIEWDEDPGGAVPPGEDFEKPDGTKVLDMYKYLNQGLYGDVMRGSSGESVAESGCLDCSVAMIAMYYLRRDIPITEISKYVNSKGALDTPTALAQYGLRRGADTYSNVIDGIVGEINADRPVIVHIRGQWNSSEDGRSLHGTNNGHFLVAIGYDEHGIIVLDPGKRANNTGSIAYEDWGHVNDLYYRPVYQN